MAETLAPEKNDPIQTNDGPPQSATPPSPKTYSEEQYKKIENEKKAISVKVSSLEKANDSLNKQMSELQSEITTIKEDRDTLKEKIEQMEVDGIGDEQIKAATIRYKKMGVALEKREAQLKADKEFHAQRLGKADDIELTETATEVAAEFEGADPAKLKRLSLKAKVTSKEDLTELAEDIWTRKVNPEEKKVVIETPDSLRSHGGGDNLNNLSAKERLAEIDRRIRAGKN